MARPRRPSCPALLSSREPVGSSRTRRMAAECRVTLLHVVPAPALLDTPSAVSHLVRLPVCSAPTTTVMR